jgi:endoglucanase
MTFLTRSRLLFLPIILFSQAAHSAAINFPLPSSFGKVIVGSTKTLSFTVKNTSTTQVRLDSYWYSNTNPYKIVGGTCQFNQTTGYVVGASKSCSLSIKFSPTKIALQESKLTVGYFLNTGWTWQENLLALTGEGVANTTTTPANCTFNGQAVTNGNSVTAYSQATVPFGQSCLSQARLCSDGILSGDYSYASCSVNPAPVGCSFNGSAIAEGASVTAYSLASVPYGTSCLNQTRLCSNGVLSGNYSYASCSVNPAAACTFNGASIANGASVTAYSQATVPNGQSCSSQVRSCGNGVLSGSYSFATCSVNPAPTTGWLRVQGNKIVDDQGMPVVLKGVNIADPQHLDTKRNERPGVTARSVATSATDTYFAQVIRLPILPGNSSYPTEGFFSTTTGWDKYFANHIDPLVKELTAKGIYVIIDLHYISDYQNLFPQVQAFWKYMAPKYSNNPHVLYEIMNEPILPDSWSTWKNTIAQPITDLIRSYAPNNLILIGGPYWSSHMAGAATNPVSGTNLVYIAHVYSNQGPSMWEQQYTPVLNKFPLMITEWGFEQGGTEGGTLTYGQQFESWMRVRDLSWTVWSFDTVWGPRMFNSDWSLKNSPSGMGTFIRDLLLEQHQK